MSEERDQELPQPNVGTDPMAAPQEGPRKRIVAPDPAKVRRADTERRRDAKPPEAPGQSERGS